jgi:hypothetical protein
MIKQTDSKLQGTAILIELDQGQAHPVVEENLPFIPDQPASGLQTPPTGLHLILELKRNSLFCTFGST